MINKVFKSFAGIERFQGRSFVGIERFQKGFTYMVRYILFIVQNMIDL